RFDSVTIGKISREKHPLPQSSNNWQSFLFILSTLGGASPVAAQYEDHRGGTRGWIRTAGILAGNNGPGRARCGRGYLQTDVAERNVQVAQRPAIREETADRRQRGNRLCRRLAGTRRRGCRQQLNVLQWCGLAEQFHVLGTGGRNRIVVAATAATVGAEWDRCRQYADNAGSRWA